MRCGTRPGRCARRAVRTSRIGSSRPGARTVFSYVVHHHPKVPGKTLPFVVALVELEEGVRMIGELIDTDPSSVSIGMPVQLALTKIDDQLTLPLWKPSHERDERLREEQRQPRAEGAPESQDRPERSERPRGTRSCLR